MCKREGTYPPITALDLGSCAVDDKIEPYTDLPVDVPGSRVIAVDIVHGEYAEGWEAHPAVIAAETGLRTFYHGLMPATNSLYPLNSDFLRRYSGLQYHKSTHTEEVQVVSLDDFTEPHRPIHFIKADIQGAEAEAFEGGKATLADTLMIVSEVLCAPLYVGAPLFRDTDAMLARRGFDLYRFLGSANRPESPFPETPELVLVSRMMWADCVYVRRDLFERADTLDLDAMRRCAVLADLYGLYSLAGMCIEKYGGRAKADEYIADRTRRMRDARA